PVTLYDNIMCQHRLVTEQFGIERVKLVTGFSMGAQQAFHWGALFPDMVERILPWCGSAKTSRHNFVFLEGAKAAITADDAWQGGWYEQQPSKGLRAMARVYSGWVVSQAFYREELYLQTGASSLEDFLIMAEGSRLSGDANNFLAMLWSWQHADISANALYNGDFGRALGAITARAIVMPCQTDLYFPPEDNALEVRHMPHAELRPIPSLWGHMAGRPGANPADTAYVDQALKELLAGQGGGSACAQSPLLHRLSTMRLNVRRQGHSGVCGRHGDRTVKRSTPLPGLHEPLGLLRLHPPHLEVHPDSVVDRDLCGLFIWITIRLD